MLFSKEWSLIILKTSIRFEIFGIICTICVKSWCVSLSDTDPSLIFISEIRNLLLELAISLALTVFDEHSSLLKHKG
jgi:hypothetical protein